MSVTSFQDIFEAGELGDTPLDIRLTTRELAALEFVVAHASHLGVFETAYRNAAEYGLDEQFGVAFMSAQARLGILMARALGRTDDATEFAVLLARVDQDQSALDHSQEA